MLTWLVNNSNNEFIQRVSDEDKREECEFFNTRLSVHGVGRQDLKGSVRG
jgi:hypothetical protein